MDVFADFIINQFMDFIFLSEHSTFPVLMLPNSAFQVIRYAGVQNGVVCIGHYIDTIMLFNHRGLCYLGERHPGEVIS
jgi:hypothetical protein